MKDDSIFIKQSYMGRWEEKQAKAKSMLESGINPYAAVQKAHKPRKVVPPEPKKKAKQTPLW